MNWKEKISISASIILFIGITKLGSYVLNTNHGWTIQPVHQGLWYIAVGVALVWTRVTYPFLNPEE